MQDFLPKDFSTGDLVRFVTVAKRLPAVERERRYVAVDELFSRRYCAIPGYRADKLADLIADMEAVQAVDPAVCNPATIADLKRYHDARRQALRCRLAAAAGLMLLVLPIFALLLTVAGWWNWIVVAELAFFAVVGVIGLRWTRTNATCYVPRPEQLPLLEAAYARLAAFGDVVAPPLAAAPGGHLVVHRRTAPRARQHRSGRRRRRSTSRSGSDPGDPAPPAARRCPLVAGVASC